MVVVTILVRMGVIALLASAFGAAYIEFAHPQLNWIPDEAELRAERAVREVRSTQQAMQAQADAQGGSSAGAKDLALTHPADLTLEQFAEMAQGALVIDAREAHEFKASRLAVDAIVNLPPEQAASEAYRLEGLIASDVPMVIYCGSETCDASKVVYGLIKQQYPEARAYVFIPGWEGIEAAGLETSSELAFEWDVAESVAYGFAGMRLEFEAALPVNQAVGASDGEVAGASDGR